MAAWLDVLELVVQAGGGGGGGGGVAAVVAALACGLPYR